VGELHNIAVSIIVPVYNVSKYIGQCIYSLLNQTLQNIEIIFVDDGSWDESGKICDIYAKRDKRIKVIHQENMGLGLSRNSGLEIAQGEFVGFVDSDDYVSIDMFEILYFNALNTKSDISYCSYRKFYGKRAESINTYNNIHIWEGKNKIKKYLLDRIGLPAKEKNDNLYGASVWCGIYKRSLLEDNHIKFVSERQFISEDIIFDIDIIPLANRIVHSDKQLYYYRFNPQSLTTVYKAGRFEKNIQLYKEMCRRLNSIYQYSEYKNSVYRYFLVFSRIAIMQEVQFIDNNGTSYAERQIKKICSNKILQKILKEYNWKEFPVKYRFICFLQKRKAVKSLVCLIKLYKIKRKWHI